MTSLFKLSRVSLVILLVLFLTTACNNNSGDEKKTDEPSADSSEKESADPINQPQQALTGGTLDTLWTDSLSFANLPKKKVVFVFTFRALDTLTLHGWAAEKDTIFNPDPDIKLLKGRASTLSYGDGMYFGNVILKKAHVAHIKKALIREKAQFVLFAPRIVNSTHVGYTIFVSKEQPNIAKEFVPLPTGVIANPSPPKNY